MNGTGSPNSGASGIVEWLGRAIIPGLVVWSLGVSVGGIWWASDLTRRLWVAEQAIGGNGHTVERIAKMEQRIENVDKTLDKIELKIDRVLEQQNRDGR
jgi:hypothetical protein